MRPRVTGALLLCLAFLLGAGAGALGLGVYLARTERWGPPRGARAPGVILQHLTRELALTPAQQTQVAAILQATGAEFAQLRAEVRPRFQALRERSRTQLRAVLTPEQQPRFDALAAAWERRWERGRATPPGPAAGGAGRP